MYYETLLFFADDYLQFPIVGEESEDKSFSRFYCKTSFQKPGKQHFSSQFIKRGNVLALNPSLLIFAEVLDISKFTLLDKHP